MGKLNTDNELTFIIYSIFNDLILAFRNFYWDQKRIINRDFLLTDFDAELSNINKNATLK